MKKLFALTLVGIFTASLASAASLEGKFGIYGNVGYSTYAMTQINKIIDDYNELFDLAQQAYPDATIEKMENISGGLTFGGGVQYGITPNIIVGLDVGYLSAGTKGSAEAEVPVGFDPYTWQFIYETQKVESELTGGALTIGPVAKYVLPVGENMLLGGGVGVDYVSASGKSSSTTTTGAVSDTSEDKFAGSAIGFRILVTGEMLISPEFGIGLDLGYRIASVTELKYVGGDYDGEVVEVAIDGNLENMELEFSGLIAQLNVKVYF